MNINDGDFDKVIAGKSGVSGPEAAEMRRILAEVNSAYVGPVSPSAESRHLSAIQQANRNRAPQASTAAPAGFRAVTEPWTKFFQSLRRSGYAHLSGATAVWAVVVALFFVSATGGLAAAGALPASLQSAVSDAAASVGIDVPRPEVAVTVSDPASYGAVSANEANLAAQRAALASAEQAVQAAGLAQKAAQEAAATSARCVDESMSKVSALVDQILAAATPAQAQAMVTQAGNVGSEVKSCADQARALGQAGVDHAGEASRLAAVAAQAAPALSEQGRSAVAAAEKAARTATSSAGQSLAMTQSIVDNVTNLATSLLDSSLNLAKATAPASPPPQTAGTPAPPSAANFTNPGAWATWGMDYANEITRSFMGGAGRLRRQ